MIRKHIDGIDAIISTVSMKAIQQQYKQEFPNKFVGGLLTPFINTSKFNHKNVDKIYDICIYGNMEFYHDKSKIPINVVDQHYMDKYYPDGIPDKVNFYPLRYRLKELVLKHKDKYRIKHITTSNQGWKFDTRGSNLSKIINQSYLTIATRSRIDKCMQKYFEISASDSTILGDIPTDFKHILKDNIVEINMHMTDQEILDIIDRTLEDKDTLVTKSKQFGEIIRRKYGSSSGVTEEFEQLCEDIINFI
jgi:hypothetical protein